MRVHAYAETSLSYYLSLRLTDSCVLFKRYVQKLYPRPYVALSLRGRQVDFQHPGCDSHREQCVDIFFMKI